MSTVFKGPWLHWGVLSVAALLMCLAGLRGWHVREFSGFLALVLAVSFALVLLVGRSRHRDG